MLTVWLINVNHEPVDFVFISPDEIEAFVKEHVPLMGEYMNLDFFKVEIPKETPKEKRHETAFEKLMKRQKEIAAEDNAIKTIAEDQMT